MDSENNNGSASAMTTTTTPAVSSSAPPPPITGSARTSRPRFGAASFSRTRRRGNHNSHSIPWRNAASKQRTSSASSLPSRTTTTAAVAAAGSAGLGLISSLSFDSNVGTEDNDCWSTSSTVTSVNEYSYCYYENNNNGRKEPPPPPAAAVVVTGVPDAVRGMIGANNNKKKKKSGGGGNSGMMAAPIKKLLSMTSRKGGHRKNNNKSTGSASASASESTRGATMVAYDSNKGQQQSVPLALRRGRHSLPADDNGDGSQQSIRFLSTSSTGHRNRQLHHARRSPSSSSQQPPTLPESIGTFASSVDALARSEELRSVFASAGALLLSAGRLAVHTALLPVTVPVRAACATTDLVAGGCARTAAILHRAVLATVFGVVDDDDDDDGADDLDPTVLLLEDAKDEECLSCEEENEEGQEQPAAVEETEEEKRGDDDDLIAQILDFPGAVMDAASKFTDELLQVVAPGLVRPPQPELKPEQPPPKPEHEREEQKCFVVDLPKSNCAISSIVQTKNDDDFLNRLRLDYVMVSPPAYVPPLPGKSAAIGSSKAGSAGSVMISPDFDPTKFSKFLLRVDDVGLLQGEENRRICFVDLEQYKDEPKLVNRALDNMVTSGIALLSNHPTVRLGKKCPAKNHPKSPMEWKPEAGTSKTLRKMVKMTTLERLRTLESEILVWSGKIEGQYYPYFLARGVVQRSPLEFMHLLWDNSRTTEYNDYCLGRTNLLVLDDEVLSGSTDTGTKVIKSDTRVPFTNLSVMVSCMMHVRPLEGPDDGFIIVSRSCSNGLAGTHADYERIEPSEAKNEILWGINVIRRVPNHPNLTDLTSLSQVGTSLVPRFLASKIGLMGVEDFFRNVRKNTAGLDAKSGGAQSSPPSEHAYHRSSTC